MISRIVFIYRKYYITINKRERFDQSQFIIILFLFVTSMFFLVFSYSWFLIILGWDGLGLVSFLLVIYYKNKNSLLSGLITVFTNRIGDCFFLLRFIYFFFLDNFIIFNLENNNSKLLILIIILGSITKSAQFPFYSWLPEAMAAPTPVSSLVHSSTLVTAGIFLIVRFNFFFHFNNILTIIALITIFIGGLIAIMEKDFKKLVAISTLSQIGFIIFSISIGNWILCYVHILFHAFFKSSLFLSTGSLMHYLYGNQDSRLYRNYYNSYFGKIYFIIRCLNLIGFPFFLGFYSKDIILSYILFWNRSFIILVFLLSCIFTVRYRIRLLLIRFLGFSKFFTNIRMKENYLFFIPVLILFFFNLFLGNFFLYNVFFLNLCSIVDYLVGLFVILIGYLIRTKFKFSYSFIFILSNMLIIPLTIKKLLVINFNFSNFYHVEKYWITILVPFNLENLILSSIKIINNLLLKLKFTNFVLYILIIFLIIY